MTNTEAENIAIVRRYLAALEEGQTGEMLARFFNLDVVQTELPNRLNPNGARSNLSELLNRAEQGRKVLREQHFQILSEIAQGDRVAVEADWRGVLAVPLGSLQPGATIEASFAMFFELHSGRIGSQRNYDCFMAW